MGARTRRHGTTKSSALVSALGSGLLLIPLVACSPKSATAVASQRAAVESARRWRRTCEVGGVQRPAGPSGPAGHDQVGRGNGNWVYVGLTPNDRNDPQESDNAQGNDQPILNPITGKMEYNGTAILEISDPSKPKFVWHIPNDVAHVNSRSVSVVYDFGPAKRDYLIRSL